MKDRTASLGMYDAPGLRAANDALWAAIAQRLDAAGARRIPSALDRARPLADLWSDPDLLLAQTCGYPLMTRWHGRLRIVATPHYRAPGCDGAWHRSRIVVRSDDPVADPGALRGARAALNDIASNTGMNLFRRAIADHAGGRPFFASVVQTGSHRESARLVATGAADVAAIDAVTFAHLDREEPAITARLRTLAWTKATPGLPFVTSMQTSRHDLALLRAALHDIAQDPALADTRAALLIDGFETLHTARYRRVLAYERDAIRSGYPLLA